MTTSGPSTRYDSLFSHYGLLAGIDPLLLRAQAAAESNMDPDVQSPVGAKGLCQFMDATWAGISAGFKHPYIWNPEQAIRGQAKYMAELLRECKTTELALAAYNWGIGRVRRTFLVSGRPYDPALVPPETRDYVQRILTIWRSA